MKNIWWSALIGAGIALIAFALDWLCDLLDETDEAEPLWPASKPFSRTFTNLIDRYDQPNPPHEPPTEEEKARIKAWVNEEIEKRMTGG